MQSKTLASKELFSDGSEASETSSVFEESSLSPDADDEPKPFLATLSSRTLQSSAHAVVERENNSGEDGPEKKSVSRPMSGEIVLNEVKNLTSHRRILSLTPQDRSRSGSEPKRDDSPDNSHPPEVFEATKQSTSTDMRDPLECTRSYVNIHASRRAFNTKLTQRMNKQQSDEARMQSLMLMNIFLNRRDQNQGRFPRNVYITSKYTAWNFLFINLFEQFSRVANFVFLLVTLVQLIPGVSPFNIWSTLLPLIFILLVTALKEGYEDLLRHRADNVTNHVLYQRVTPDGACERCE